MGTHRWRRTAAAVAALTLFVGDPDAQALIDFEAFPDGYVPPSPDYRGLDWSGGRVIWTAEAGGAGGFANPPSGVAVWEITSIGLAGGDWMSGVQWGRTRFRFLYASSDPVAVELIEPGWCESFDGVGGAVNPVACPVELLPPTQDASEPLHVWRAYLSPPAPEEGLFIKIVAPFEDQRVLIDDLVLPEPSTSALLAIGVGMLTRRKRRR